MSALTPKLPPLDVNLAPGIADADLARRETHLRKMLAEGGTSDSRRRLLEAELRSLKRTDGDAPS